MVAPIVAKIGTDVLAKKAAEKKPMSGSNRFAGLKSAASSMIPKGTPAAGNSSKGPSVTAPKMSTPSL